MSVAIADASREFAESLIHEQGLRESLAAVTAALGEVGATLVIGHTERNTVEFTDSITECVQDYFAGWNVKDPREAKVHPNVAGGFTSDYSDFSAEEIAREPFYQDFLFPRGFGWHATATLSVTPAPWVLSLKRPTERGPFSPDEIHSLDTALPVLRNATAFACRAWRAAIKGDVALLERLGKGAIVIDRDQRVIEANAASPLGDGMVLANGRLRAHLNGEVRPLNDLINACTAATRTEAVPSVHRAIIHRHNTPSPLLVECIALRQFRRDLPSGAAMLLVTTELRTAQSTLASADVRRLFHLTAKEAELCLLLARGHAMTDCAERLKITANHVRQRARNVYAKVGVRSQVELAATLARL